LGVWHLRQGLRLDSGHQHHLRQKSTLLLEIIYHILKPRELDECFRESAVALIFVDRCQAAGLDTPFFGRSLDDDLI
jgi:hypothetical protein